MSGSNAQQPAEGRHPAFRFLDLTASTGSVQFVNVDRHVSALPEPLRETDVVGVDVSQDDASNVIQRATKPGKFGVQLPPVAGLDRVGDHDPGWILD
jgi:hypothetical protein